MPTTRRQSEAQNRPTSRSAPPSPADFDPSGAAIPGSGIYGLPHGVDDARIVVLPVPFDATTCLGEGTRRGPESVFRISGQLDLGDPEFDDPWRDGIAMMSIPKEIERLGRRARRAARPIIEAGGEIGTSRPLARALAEVNAASERVNEWVEAQAGSLLERGKLVCVLGGDHSVVYGSIRAHARRWPGLGILHFDAHADLRVAFEGFTWSHASIFHNVLSRIPEVSTVVQVGIRDVAPSEQKAIAGWGARVRPFWDDELARRRSDGEPWRKIADDVVAPLPPLVYCSFDIDALEPSLCPHTGTPAPGGLSWHEAIEILRAVVRSGRRIVGFDLSEVAPGDDGRDWDGTVGARLLYKMIGFAHLSAKR
jgi:agmatinase